MAMLEAAAWGGDGAGRACPCGSRTCRPRGSGSRHAECGAARGGAAAGGSRAPAPETPRPRRPPRKRRSAACARRPRGDPAGGGGGGGGGAPESPGRSGVPRRRPRDPAGGARRRATRASHQDVSAQLLPAPPPHLTSESRTQRQEAESRLGANPAPRLPLPRLAVDDSMLDPGPPPLHAPPRPCAATGGAGLTHFIASPGGTLDWLGPSEPSQWF